MEKLYQAAGPQQRLRMDVSWKRKSDELSAAGDLTSISAFLRFYGDLFDLSELSRRAAQLPLSGNWLEDEFLSLKLAQSVDSETAASAAARCALLLIDADQPRDAGVLMERIERDWPETPALDGKSGRELVAAWKRRSDVGPFVAPSDPWPTGQVLVERDHTVGNPTGNAAFRIPFEGARGPFFENSTLEVGGNWQNFVVRDAWSRPVWKLALDDQIQPANYALNRVWARDHFLLVSIGAQVLAIDALGTADAPGPRLLWRMNLADLAIGHVSIPRGGAMRGRLPINQFGEPPGAIGPISRDAVILQKGRKLMALDPFSGKPLWIRDGVLPGSELIGDDAFLCIIPPDANPIAPGTAVVVRMLDGEIVGNRVLPQANVRLEPIESGYLTWQSVAGRQELARFDIVGERVAWKRGFSIDALATIIDSETAGILEPEGRFAVVSLKDGHVEYESTVETFGTAQQIFVQKDRDQYILFCNEPLELADGAGIAQISPLPQNLFIHGKIHGFDRHTGKRTWTTRMERQGYDPNQPAALPILTFFATRVEQKPPGRAEQRMSLTCVDKRTGRVVFDDRQLDEPYPSIEFLPDLDERQIELRLVRSTLRLKFTDKPWPE
jgi:hypothetical protein